MTPSLIHKALVKDITVIVKGTHGDVSWKKGTRKRVYKTGRSGGGDTNPNPYRPPPSSMRGGWCPPCRKCTVLVTTGRCEELPTARSFLCAVVRAGAHIDTGSTLPSLYMTEYTCQNGSEFYDRI